MLTWMEYPTGTRVFKTRVPSSVDPDLLFLVSPFRPNPFPRRARRSLSLQLHRLSLQPLPRFTNAHLYDVLFARHRRHRRSGQRILRHHQQSFIFFRSSFLQVVFFFFWSKSYFPSLLFLFSFSIFKFVAMELESLKLKFHVTQLLHRSSRTRVWESRFFKLVSSF